MTVKSLIEKLQRLNPNYRIVVDGYEGGYADIVISGSFKLALNQHTEWYYGKHDEAKFEGNEKRVNAYKLGRK